MLGQVLNETHGKVKVSNATNDNEHYFFPINKITLEFEVYIASKDLHADL